MNGIQSETALVILGILAVAPPAVWGAMLLSGKWKITSPGRPQPPKTPVSAVPEENPAAETEQEQKLAAAA